MSVPKYGLVSTGAPGGRVPPTVRLDGITELRVHGVGGTPPDALLNDLAPEQVAGDNIAGFYRTADYFPPPGTVSRHVEGYSWGGLTSRSAWRVFWLLLLPFMLGNLAGWMCSARTKGQGKLAWRFRLHRASVNLACLALTINVVLVTAMMTADVAAYQAVRVGADKGRWWLAPLRWPGISGHPARQVLLGILVPVVVVSLLAVLGRRSRFRYERVQPPYETATPPARALTVAAALEDGISDARFWDGEHSVKHSSIRHIAASIGFLGLMLAITSRDSVVAAAVHANAAGWWWAALAGSAAVLAFVIVRTCVDVEAKRLDDWSSDALLAVAIAALCCAGIFAWLQPAATAVAGQLPGMAGIFGWTLTVVAVILGLVLVSSGISGRTRGTLFMGPLVTTVVAFSLLNVTLFGLMLTIAHLLGNLTFAAAPPVAQIYLPEPVGFGTPALVMGVLAAALVVALAELIMWWRAGQGDVKTAIKQEYVGNHAATPSQSDSQPQSADLDLWQCSALDPPRSDGQGDDGTKWAASIARAQRIGRASRDAGWLLWALAVFEIAAVVVTVTVQPAIAPDRWFGKAAITVATLLPAFLIGQLRAGWGQQDRRRRIGILWDVGTFWPRSYHPLAPPCYAERAVPELQRRLWWIHDNDGHVLLAAHSQGSVLAAAALAQPGCLPPGNKSALATFGSPLGKLYSWAFPAYVNDDVLGRLIEKDPRGWTNFHYPTDPIGGAAFQDGEGQPVDVFLLDPAGYQYIYGQPAPTPGGHSGYWTDPRVWVPIGKLASDILPPPPAPQPLDPPVEPAQEPVG
jgi:hypothetical protein